MKGYIYNITLDSYTKLSYSDKEFREDGFLNLIRELYPTWKKDHQYKILYENQLQLYLLHKKFKKYDFVPFHHKLLLDCIEFEKKIVSQKETIENLTLEIEKYKTQLESSTKKINVLTVQNDELMNNKNYDKLLLDFEEQKKTIEQLREKLKNKEEEKVLINNSVEDKKEEKVLIDNSVEDKKEGKVLINNSVEDKKEGSKNAVDIPLENPGKKDFEEIVKCEGEIEKKEDKKNKFKTEHNLVIDTTTNSIASKKNTPKLTNKVEEEKMDLDEKLTEIFSKDETKN